MAKKTAQIIDGKALAEKIIIELRKKIQQLPKPPGLATILVGDDASSQLFVNNKKKACRKAGIEFHDYLCGRKDYYPNITQNKILEVIDWLNRDQDINGIIVQLPLPKKFDTQKIINQINPQKDVDGFHPKNTLKIIRPPLIEAIKLALAYTKEKIHNKKTVIIAKNSIFSDPLAKALKKEGLKVSVVSPNDKNLADKTKVAEILIVVVGQKGLIKKSMIKDGAIVIDAGTNLTNENHWVGDVDSEVKEVASFMTPVPGGIGPLTVAMLLKNVYETAKNQ